MEWTRKLGQTFQLWDSNLRNCFSQKLNRTHGFNSFVKRASPSMGNTDGSFIEGDIALLSTAATSASRPRALTGGVVDSLGRLVRLDRPDEEGRADDSLLRSAGKPVAAGFRSTAGALGSPPWLFDPRAMKSPGGGCAAKWGQQCYNMCFFFFFLF